MSPPDWPRLGALIAAELRSMARDRWTTLSLVLMMLFMGALGHVAPLLPERDPEPPDERPVPAWRCQPGVLEAVAVVGEQPEWLRWPDPLVPAEQAEVLLRISPGDHPDDRLSIEAIGLTEDTRVNRVVRCVSGLRYEERRARLDALGISEAPGSLVRTQVLHSAAGAKARDPMLDKAPLGITLGGGLFLLLMSMFLDLGPRARSTGWIEAWLCMPGRRSDLVWAWWLLGVGVGAVGVLLVLLGHIVGGHFSQLPTGTVHWPSALVSLPLFSALALRVFMDTPDMRTALVRSGPLFGVMFLLVPVALVAEQTGSGFGELVPLGGLLLGLVGVIDAPWTAIAVSLVLTAWMLRGSARTLDSLSAGQNATTRTAARRARGDYRVEVTVLTLLAISGTTAWHLPGMAQGDPVTATFLTLVAFMGIPAVAVGGLLRLPRRALLSWRSPRLRAWLLLPLVVMGTLGVATLAWNLTLHLMPESPLTEMYAQSMQTFTSPWGLLVVSLTPGLCEELLFRGAILGLLRRRMGVWGAVFVQAALFALVHGMAVRLPYTFALGLILGFIVVRSGSLWPAIAVHTLHNLSSAGLGEHLPGWDSPWFWVMSAVGLGAVAATPRAATGQSSVALPPPSTAE